MPGTSADPRRSRLPAVVAVACAIAAAIALRASADFAGPLLPKANGAYYLVQARALLEHGRLGFPDLPLLFLLEALVARVIELLGAPREQAIVLAVKLVDTVLPSLAAIPAFLLGSRMATRSYRRQKLLAGIAAAAWAVLSVSPVSMVGDFQKNALAMVWIACLALSLHTALSGRASRGLAWAAAALALAALTHVGAFGVCVAFAAATGVAAFALADRDRRRRVLVAAGGAAALLAVLAAAYLALDPRRLARVGTVAVSLFRNPFAAALLARPGPSLFDLVAVHVICVAGLVTLLRRWKELDLGTRAVAVAAIATALFLASPLLGSEWAERFHLMAYAPAGVPLAYLVARAGSQRLAALGAGIVVAAALALSVPSVGRLREPAIPAESYPELAGLRASISDPGRTLVIARHGLEWWAAWALSVKVGQEFGVEPAVWKEYDAVYFLRYVGGPRQVPGAPAGGRQGPVPPPRKGFAPGSPQAGGSGGPAPFPEVRVPDDAVLVHRGPFYELWHAGTPPSFYPLSRPEQ